MKLEIDLHHVASGPFFFASGKARPDAYRFERVKEQGHIHRLTIDDVTGEKASAVLKDLGLRLQQADIPVLFKIIVEESDLDEQEALAVLNAERVALQREVAALEAKLRQKPAKPAAPQPEAKAGITDEQLAMLTERDQMLELLAPFAEGEDTPLDVVKRAADALKKPAKKPK